MVYYIASRFHLPRRFWDYIYLSQVTQDTCIADATEHWRRHKGQCNGAMYWQFNDCWGVCSWSSLDYYGNYKALQYGARRFNAPLSVSVEDSKDRFDVYVLNDLNARQTVTVEYELFDFVTGTLEKEKKKLLLPPSMRWRILFFSYPLSLYILILSIFLYIINVSDTSVFYQNHFFISNSYF